MPSLEKDSAKNGNQHFTVFDENSESTRKTQAAEDLFQMQAYKKEAREKIAASALSTPQKTGSVEQGYLSPPDSVSATESSRLSKKRAAEDELSSSPNKKIMILPPRHKIVGNFRGHVRTQLLRNQMANKIKLDEAEKENLFAGAFEHLPNVDPLRPLNCKIDSARLWDEETLNLGQYPRLVTTKLTYRYDQLKNPWTDAWEYVCFPIAPADDIEKSLHVGHGSRHTKWTGFWAEQKLQKEIAKYEAIKEFWLFNYAISTVVPFLAGLDKKEEFCAGLFSEELQSPWVRCWLREFLGDEIMDAIEIAMGSIDEGHWKKASDNILDQQARWESLCLRFKRHDTFV